MPAGWLRPAVARPGAVTGAAGTAAGVATPVGGAVLPAATPAATRTPTPTPAPGGPAVPDLPGADPRSVSVAATEFAFTLSQPRVKAGRVRIQFDNSRAQDPHALLAHGLDDLVVSQVGPGRVTAVAYDLDPGTYTLYCPILDHEALGMQVKLIVDP